VYPYICEIPRVPCYSKAISEKKSPVQDGFDIFPHLYGDYYTGVDCVRKTEGPIEETIRDIEYRFHFKV
jgi:hypothetical protein